MKKTIAMLSLMGLMVLPAIAEDKNMKEADRVEAAGHVISEIMNVPDDILSAEGGLHCRWQLRPGSDDLPQRPRLPWPLERSYDDGPGRRQLWLPAGRSGN